MGIKKDRLLRLGHKLLPLKAKKLLDHIHTDVEEIKKNQEDCLIRHRDKKDV